MPIFLGYFLMVFFLFLQSTVLQWLTIYGIKPELMLLPVVFFAFFKGPRVGILVGFLGGITQDILLGQFIGLHALATMAMGYAVGLAEKELYKDSLMVAGGITFLAVAVRELLVLALGVLVGLGYPSDPVVLKIIFFTAFYTSLWVPFFYRLFYRIIRSGWSREGYRGGRP